VSGDAVASAAVRRRQRRSIPKITLTSASKTLQDQFDLIRRHQTRSRACRCDRLIIVIGAMALLAPDMLTDIGGAVIVGAMLVHQYITVSDNLALSQAAD